MATIALHENKLSLTSFALLLVSLSYFFIPHVGILKMVYRFNTLYLLIIPITAFILTILVFRKARAHHERPGVLSYISLGMCSLYMISLMAIPVVLIGLYLLYTFVV